MKNVRFTIAALVAAASLMTTALAARLVACVRQSTYLDIVNGIAHYAFDKSGHPVVAVPSVRIKHCAFIPVGVW